MRRWTFTLALPLLLLAGSRLYSAPASSNPDVAAVVRKVQEWLHKMPAPPRVAQTDWRIHRGDAAGAAGLSFDDASWQPYHVGEEWGPENSVAWFRRTITVPELLNGVSTAGRGLVLELSMDDDGVAYVDGKLMQRFHWDAGYVPLTHRARPGQRFQVAVEGLNGPGTGRLFRAELVMEADPVQIAAQGYLDSEAFTLEKEKTSPRRAATLSGFERRAAAEISQASLNVPPAAGLRAAFERASKALADPEVHQLRDGLVGYAHTDVDWLWQWADTKETWFHDGRTMLVMLREHPDLYFSQTQAVLYRAMQQEHPEFFADMQAAVKSGRWEPLNGWCENDMNMPSGESQIRQALLSNEYYQQQFGVTSPVCWRPDSFGHAWTLPMILSQTGVDSYYFCRAGRGVAIFWWEAPDGSRILAFNSMDPEWYNATVDTGLPAIVTPRMEQAHAREWLTSFGVGDHGGGPTRRDIEEVHRLNALPAMPRLQMTRARDLFQRLRKEEPAGGYPVIRAELNPTFNGCYTSHVDTKRMNRQLEHSLYSAEAWSMLAAMFGAIYPGDTLRESWYDTLRNQFHDILAGSNIHPSYEFSSERDRLALSRANGARTQALDVLLGRINTTGHGGTPIVVFNSLSWPRTEVVRIPFPGPTGAAFEIHDPAGRLSLGQVVHDPELGERLEFVATDVPSMGYRVYWIDPTSIPPEGKRRPGAVLESASFKVNYDEATGLVTGIYDKAHQRDLIAPGGAADRLDVLWEGGGSAWDLGPITSTTPSKLASAPAVSYGTDGSETLTIVNRYNNSVLTHRVILHPGIPRVDFDLDVDWHEQGIAGKGGAFLKTTFDTTMNHPHAWWEIPFGAIERAAGGEESVGLKWIDVDESKQTTLARKTVPAPLDSIWTGDAFSTTALPTKGSFDQQGVSYREQILPEPGIRTVQGVPFIIADPAGTRNVVSANGQTLAAPSNAGGDLYLLAAAGNGGASGDVSVLYGNGRVERTSLAVSDWVTNDYAQPVAFTDEARLTPTGPNEVPTHIYLVHVALHGDSPIRSITLPRESRIHVFAVTIGARVLETPTFGLALLNDGRYGSDIKSGRMRMSLIRSARDPDPIFDVGRHFVRYSLYPHEGGWQSSDVARQAWSLNTPLEGFVTTAHAGPLPQAFSFMEVSGPGVVTTAVKRSEDGTSTVVRFYNASSAATRAHVQLNLPSKIGGAWLADMKETPERSLKLNGQTVDAPLKPWSSATVLLR